MIVDIVLGAQPNFNLIIFGDVMVNVLVASSIVHTLAIQRALPQIRQRLVSLLVMVIISLIVKENVLIRI